MFDLQLAHFLGFPHSRHMLESLTWDEYEDWVQFAAQFNIDHNRDDLHWGVMIADFRNANKGDGDVSVRPIDCMPYYDPFAEEITAEELVSRLPGKTS